MNAGQGRQRAYSDLLTGLIDLGPTTASDRFDELLTQARAAGQISDDTARVLRWWQREALRAQADHVLTTAPTLLAALDQASGEAIESADRAERSWDAATGVTDPVRPSADGPPRQPPAAPPVAHEPAAPTAPARESTPPAALAGRHRGIDEEADTPLFDQMLAMNDPSSTAAAPSTDSPVVTSTIEIPNVDAPSSFAPDPAARVVIGNPLVPPAELPVPEPVADVLDITVSARRRRLLVAGLTVIDEELNRSQIADPP